MFQKSDLPQSIEGRINLDWRTGNTKSMIYLAQKEISLPLERLKEIHILQNGQQFLAKFEFEQLQKSRAAVLFGVDGQVFATRISKMAFKTFENGGEEAFYEFLEPPLIRYLEQKLGEKAKRQGEIWAIHVGEGIDTDTLSIDFRPLRKRTEVLNRKLFGTNHRLFGWVISGHVFISDGKERLVPTYLAEGIIRTRDHAPLEISPGAHILAISEAIVRGAIIADGKPHT